MAGYLFREQEDMLIAYGRANRRRRVAKQVYRKAFPDEKQPDHPTLAAA
jgi:hypothetical protein